MSKIKRWRVVLNAKIPPVCGDWVAIAGLIPGEEETPRFTFLDGSQADGITFLEDKSVRGGIKSYEEHETAHEGDIPPWLHFPDCMEIVGVQSLDWRPKGWPYNKPLWLLTVESLPSNIAFERRFLDEQKTHKRWWHL